MLRLIGLVASIGLADSLNPSTVAPALYLATGERPRRAVLQFTAAVAGIFFAGGVVLTVGPGQALLALIPHPGPTVRYIAETVAGVTMLVGAALLWRNRERLGAKASSDEPPKQRSAVLLGLTIGGVELPTAFPYFAAIIAVVASGVDVVHELILIAIYNLCFVLPLLAIAMVLTVAGDRATDVLVRVRAYLRAHWPMLLAVLALIAGLFVTALGVTGLTSGVHGRVGGVSRRVRRIISH
ncbi:MAG TPA: GAP family protein [Solirubrobacteraceae bacterium]|jgi:cytochrome c biogenesis protein CcdA|nr:GAP family protein [Solirubrobacteraceae bacterium]